ncbi:uncharacterized protein SPSK_03765 [Sporothrix schenckii 1099-18]|uniref:Uncharacterized protein n=1 Tax=Sporothrix schenckii 1099-18 TaxID=1397361 RepID=A0A0F2LXT9_SPOSC|nr:uncharacterized protein SPSK_03765 [Sporothrix schenckii 1099-18]KJR82273.1 hypothetical protein SPSK_03765 [Sporothrix schenckii 1099-18]
MHDASTKRMGETKKKGKEDVEKGYGFVKGAKSIKTAKIGGLVGFDENEKGKISRYCWGTRHSTVDGKRDVNRKRERNFVRVEAKGAKRCGKGVYIWKHDNL